MSPEGHLGHLTSEVKCPLLCLNAHAGTIGTTINEIMHLRFHRKPRNASLIQEDDVDETGNRRNTIMG